MLTDLMKITSTSSSYDTNWNEKFVETSTKEILIGNSSTSNMFKTDFDSFSSTSSQNVRPNIVSKLQLEIPRVKPYLIKQKRCDVCGINGATSHYGGTVCGGCKIFFSRTVQSGKGFVCEKEGQCPMRSGKRAKCRACRYQLCLKAHMSPEEVGRLKDLRMGDVVLPSIKNVDGIMVEYFDDRIQPSTSIADSIHEQISFIDCFEYNHKHNDIIQLFVNLELSMDNNVSFKVPQQYMKINDISSTLRDAVIFPLPICARIPMNLMRRKFRKDPSKLLRMMWSRNILHYLEWCGSIEDLNLLTFEDKMRLISINMLPVMLLVSSFGYWNDHRNCQSSEPNINSNSSYIKFLKEIRKISKEAEFACRKASNQIIELIQQIELTIEEMVILKLIVFFNDGCTISKKNEVKIRCLRMKYCDLLRKTVIESERSENCMSRLSLILELPLRLRNTSVYMNNLMTAVFASNICGMQENLVYEFHVRSKEVLL